MTSLRVRLLTVVLATAASVAVFTSSPAPAEAAPGDIEVEKADPKAVQLLNDFLAALAIADETASAKACLPLVHKSLMNPAKDDLSSDLRRFSFKKAHDNAKFYAQPVKITRIRPKNISGIGAKSNGTAELGAVHDYFVAKKEGGAGLPAPVQIFFPQGGGEPKIAYMGSL